MRDIAEAAFEMVRASRVAFAASTGTDLSRSEFHARYVRCSPRRALSRPSRTRSIRPKQPLNPGRSCAPYRMDDRARPCAFRTATASGSRRRPGSTGRSVGPARGGAVEMCNNNGTCRKSLPKPCVLRYRVTQDEQHVTRGRANSLRLAMIGSARSGCVHLARDEGDGCACAYHARVAGTNARRASIWRR